MLQRKLFLTLLTFQDDSRMFDYNVDERVKTFLNYTLQQVGSKLPSSELIDMVIVPSPTSLDF